ncbi:deoxyribodipyrimidine photo-lyase type II [Trichococcus patagoniensis]|uniref:Deoxyribodipyrimidine photo-lyase n=1 Tax=Trichococcus patagoniensis TaxID=382641 RepID=A0A2T5IM75_9LACT|nr:deoxyribodipyrimidine photo-lyase [Trichococcus patagoniensis]PTQ84926.1 deoxyribodipyrimidine photo-lyase type II [Trichococcus patagoniensis]
MIMEERIKQLNEKNAMESRPFVVYWMQSSQRAEYNHALEYAIRQANRLEKPLVVYFGITDGFPEANERHYAFMLEGLKETKNALEQRGIQLLIRKISPEKGALEMTESAAQLVVDRGYLRIERQWRAALAEDAECAVVQVESNVIVPVELASPKEEYSAATLRSKLKKVLPDCLAPLEETICKHPSIDLELPYEAYDILDVAASLDGLDIDRSVLRVSDYIGGTGEAKQWLEEFIENKLAGYSERKNRPGESFTSNLSPYLHFGQISPLYVYRRLMGMDSESQQSFLEELVVRRELAVNFVYYNEQYDSYAAVPDWAKKTLDKHLADERGYLYLLEELEAAKTHDDYWNAAQLEMNLTGKMHGYMRMYWAKKILEWSSTPEEAYRKAIYLNNKYLLDGRDPNGFAGVSWCFGKHDRPWGERAIFGNVRFMNDKGLKRKFDMQLYMDQVAERANM